MIISTARDSGIDACCFEHCGCSCTATFEAFDHIAERELRDVIKLNDIIRQNIGWYSDRSIDDSYIGEWGLHGLSGLYFLWHKDAYCAVHEKFHMRALYVGKGSIAKRLKSHWENKPTADAMLVYFTYAVLPNRLAKYVEQLVLDCYDIPYNSVENRGTMTLCAYFDQGDVD